MSRRKKAPLRIVGPASSIKMGDPATIEQAEKISLLFVSIVKKAINGCERRKGARCIVSGQIVANINDDGCEGIDFIRQSFIAKRFSRHKFHDSSSVLATVYYPVGVHRQKVKVVFEINVFDENDNVPHDEIAMYLHTRIKEETLSNLNRMIKSSTDEKLAQDAKECRKATLSVATDLLPIVGKKSP